MKNFKRNRQNLIKLLLFLTVFSLFTVGILCNTNNIDSENYTSVDGCHGEDTGIILTTNATANTLTFNVGQIAYLNVTLSGMSGTNLAFVFYNDDNTGNLTAPSPYGWTPNWQQDFWNSGNSSASVYFQETATDPISRIFAFSAIGSGNFTITIVGVGSNSSEQANSPPYILNVNVSAVTDVTNPDVIITSPSDGADVAGVNQIIATVTDDVVVYSVWAELTGSYIGTIAMLPQGGGVYEGAWNSSLGSDGTVTITVKANDSQSNLNDTESIIVDVDNTAPGVTINQPMDAAHVDGNINIQAAVVDTGVGIISEVWAIFSGCYNGSLELNHLSGNNYQNTLDGTTISDGLLTITIEANDSLNNVNDQESVTITVDNSAPTFVYTSHDDVEVGNSAYIQINVTDATGIQDVEWDDGPGPELNMNDDGGGLYSYTWSVGTSLGNRTYEIVLTDTLGNTYRYPESIEVVDTTPPVLSNLQEGADPVLIGEAANVSIDTSDNSGINNVSIEIDGTNITTGISDLGGGTYFYEWYPVSNTTYLFWVQDNGGNWASLGGSITVIDPASAKPRFSNFQTSSPVTEIGDWVEITIDVIDDGAITNVTITMNGTTVPMTFESGDTYSYNYTSSVAGLIPFQIIATNNNSFVSVYEGTITVEDSTPPEIKLNTDLTLVSVGGKITFNVSCNDSVGIQSVTIEIKDEEGLSTGIQSMTHDSGDIYTYEWTPSNPKNYFFTITVVDNSGCENTISGVVALSAPSSTGLQIGDTELSIIGVILIAIALIGGFVSASRRKKSRGRNFQELLKGK